MFTVWICIECLHRISRSRLLRAKRQVSSAEPEGGGIKDKKKNTSVKKNKKMV